MPAWARHGLYVRIRWFVSRATTRYPVQCGVCVYADRYQIPQCRSPFSLLRVIMWVSYQSTHVFLTRYDVSLFLLSTYIHVDDYHSAFFWFKSYTRKPDNKNRKKSQIPLELALPIFTSSPICLTSFENPSSRVYHVLETISNNAFFILLYMTLYMLPVLHSCPLGIDIREHLSGR